MAMNTETTTPAPEYFSPDVSYYRKKSKLLFQVLMAKLSYHQFGRTVMKELLTDFNSVQRKEAGAVHRKNENHTNPHYSQLFKPVYSRQKKSRALYRQSLPQLLAEPAPKLSLTPRRY